MDEAKQNELQCWISTSAVMPVLRKSLNPEQVLKSRWILTWKPVEDEKGNVCGRKAKARLVVLGFQDPQLTTVLRDAPTLSREGRNTVLQTVAATKWVLTSFDIKTAFLRGKADASNPLAMEPPPELRQKLKLSDDQVCALVGNAYGRVDAPLLFYKELGRQLKKLGFQIHPLEPCVYYLESTDKSGTRILHGVLGTHVDDGVGGGDAFYQKQVSLLREVLPFGSYRQTNMVFTGIKLNQLPGFSIHASQEEYVRNISAIDVGRHRRQTPEEGVTETELSKLRGLVGSLQYAISHTRPDIASRLGEVQSQISERGTKVSTLLLANKVLREAQETSEVKICFRDMPAAHVTHVAFGDASFASPKQLASFHGSLVFATTPALLENQEAPLSPLTWSSKKIARVVRSTLSAEAYSLSKTVDQLGWLRLLWGVLHVSDFDWKEPATAFARMPQAALITDCKSLYDLVTRLAIPACEEYRTTLEVLLIKDRCREHVACRWIPTSLQLADPLTKVMDSSLLQQVLARGRFRIFDEDFSLTKNAHRKAAISWCHSKSTSQPEKESPTTND